MKQLRQQVSLEDKTMKKQEYDAGPKASEGYGGKFGVMKDRMDKVNRVYVESVSTRDFGGAYLASDLPSVSHDSWNRVLA